MRGFGHWFAFKPGGGSIILNMSLIFLQESNQAVKALEHGYLLFFPMDRSTYTEVAPLDYI